MGLDLVEMVIRIEDEFGISLPDEEAVRILTPKDLIDFLMTVPKIGDKNSRELVALSVWLILEDEIGIKRAKYTEESRFIEDMGMD